MHRKSFWINLSAKCKALDVFERAIMDSLMLSSFFVPPFSLASLHAWLSVGGTAKSSFLWMADWIFHIKPDWSQRVTSLLFTRWRWRGGTAGSPDRSVCTALTAAFIQPRHTPDFIMNEPSGPGSLLTEILKKGREKECSLKISVRWMGCKVLLLNGVCCMLIQTLRDV